MEDFSCGFFRDQTRWLPSGKLTFCHGKTPFLMGKSTISMAIFNSFLYVHQRVLDAIGCYDVFFKHHQDGNGSHFLVRLFKLPSPDVFWFLSWPPCGQAQVHRQKIKNTWFSTFSYVLLCGFVSRPLPFWDFDHRSLICFMDFS